MNSWKVICLRIIANLSVLLLLCVSAYAVIWVVKRSSEKNDSWWRRNEITVVMSMISFIFPMLFEILGLMEYYHPRMQLRLQLARIMILNLLNLYSLIWALFGKISEMTERLTEIKTSQENKTTTTVSPPLTSSTRIPSSTVETGSVFSKITESFTQSVTEPIDSTRPTMSEEDEAFFASLITENYDSDNENYFDTEPTQSSSSTVETSSFDSLFSNFTESFIGENITELFYLDESSNFTLDANSSEDLFENSNFNMSNLINGSIFNATFPSNFTNLVFNSTNVEPIVSAYQSYSFLQSEQSSFINMDHLNASTKLELRKLCWETMFGQELVKLTVMDLVR